MGVIEKLFTEWEVKVIQTVKNAVLDGLQKTGPEAKQIIEKYMVHPSIEEYYNEFDAGYDRQYSLFDAFDVEAGFEGYDFVWEITPNPNNLPQHFSKSKYHQSGGVWRSRNGYDILKGINNGPDKWISSAPFDDDDDANGTPDNAWIVHNLIEGIHPFTVTTKLGGGESSYEYTPIYGVPLYTRFDRHKPAVEKQIMIRAIYNIKQECKKYF